MAVYHFHAKDDDSQRDSEGTDLKSLAAARVHAIQFAGSVMASEPDVLWDGKNFEVEVRDEHGLLLFIVSCHVTNAPAAGDTK